ncbi:MAG: TetR/AcrR family transcriptional regulator [Proteobacteria bacterium]|nr:TetR/AcrR family transcriptional regulator [Pseudomonadota bacterium]MBU1389636.1 TetR/AcrR family transcriptional regulator [Pseudomonadota bacterium]MBU1542574.1 TetR/AcrR family transcriptional regulator [Pseudomonadota bacterium]
MTDTDQPVPNRENSDKKLTPRQQQIFKNRQVMIVKKASKLFIKKGYSQTSMRDIANATGINLGNLYHYISGKEDILCIAFNNYHNLIMEFVIKNDILNIKEPKAKLKAVLRQSLEITYDFRNDLLMMYRETRVLPRKFLKIILKKEGEFVKLFEDIIAKGVESQAFKVSDPFFAANMLVFQISLYALRSWNLKQFTREEFLDMTEETILRAIIPDTL